MSLVWLGGGGGGARGPGPLGGLGKLPTPQASKGQSGKQRTVVRQAKDSQASKGPLSGKQRSAYMHLVSHAYLHIYL